MTKIENNLIKQLRTIGLKQNEAEIYVYLLEHNLSTPPAIAKGTGIARTNCYNILQILVEKGVVEESRKGKKKVYVARDPKLLKSIVQKQLESIDRLLPDLEAIHNTQGNKPLFRFYDGFIEIKQIYNRSLEASEIFGFGSTERLFAKDEQFLEYYTKQCHKKGIVFHDMVTADSIHSAEIMKNIQGDSHTVQFLPEEFSRNITDLLVWNDNIALISLEEPIFGTIITSKALADTLKTIFKFISSKI